MRAVIEWFARPVRTSAPPTGPSCEACTHRLTERASLETAIPGLTSLGSGFGASVAESRLCREHDRLVSPDDSCSRFQRAA
jgi:hypothetical protein